MSSMPRCSCKECFCHFIGIMVMFVSCALMVTGLVLISLYRYPDLAFSLGLGAFGLGGLLSVLFLVYMCVAFRAGWRLFGSCGKWGPGSKEEGLLDLGGHAESDLETKRLTTAVVVTPRHSAIEEGGSNPTDW